MHDGESLQKPHTSAHRNARQSGAAVCLSGAMAARFCPVPTGVRRFENLRCIHLLTCRRCERQHRNRSAQQREQNQIGEAIATNPQNTSLLMVSAGLSHTESHRKPQKARKHFGTQSTLRRRCSAIECSAVQLCSNAVHRRILLAQRILLAENRDASASTQVLTSVAHATPRQRMQRAQVVSCLGMGRAEPSRSGCALSDSLAAVAAAAQQTK